MRTIASHPVASWLRRLAVDLSAIFSMSIKRFGDNKSGEAAASISYYTIFSLFPLLILTVTAISYFLDPQVVISRLTEWTVKLPIASETIVQEVEHVLQARGAFNIVGLIGFLWAASGVFDLLVLNMDYAFRTSARRKFLHRRLVAFAMMMVVVVMLITFFAATLLDLSLLSRIFHAEGYPRINALLDNAYTNLLPYLVRLLILWLIYTVTPGRRVNGWAALVAAMIASLSWRVVTSAFEWFLTSGLATYDMVYGSLGAIIAFLTWI